MESGNIKVVVRIKPLPEAQQDQSVIQRVEDETIYLKEQASQTYVNTRFTFDKILQNSTQKEIFDCVGYELVETVFEGIHGTALMYGQTASGKTYTSMGPSLKDEDKKGLIPRIVEKIFNKIDNCVENIEFRLKISIVQIYMERIKDLLDVSKQNLKVRQSTARGVYIENVTEIYVASKEQVYHFIHHANKNRSLAHTNMNEASSRSHLVFVITTYQNNLQDMSAKSAKLTIVDLAGSQKVGKTGAQGKVLDEAKQINKSLLALGNVINSLTQDKVKHVPYRDSKLTRILQQSLGGNAMTNLIINISSHVYNEAETLSTLRFALRAKRIKNKPTVNRQYTVAELMALLQKAENKIKQQERYIKQFKKNPQTSERYSVMSMLSNMTQLDKLQSRMDEIPQVIGTEKQVKKQLEIANEQLEVFKDENISLESLVNVLKKQVQNLTEQVKQLQKQNSELRDSNENMQINMSMNRSVGQTCKTQGNRARKTKKMSLFATNLLGVKTNILQNTNSLQGIQNSPFQQQTIAVSDIKINQLKSIQNSPNLQIDDQRLQQLQNLLSQQQNRNTYLNQLIRLDKNSQQRRILQLELFIQDLLGKYYSTKQNQSNLKTNLKISQSKLSKREQRIHDLQTKISVSKESIQVIKRKHSQLENQLKSKKTSFINSIIPSAVKRPFTSLRSSSRDSKIVKVLLPTNFKLPQLQQRDIVQESDQSSHSDES